jgi:cell pole-organizing protein PopZ
MPEQGRTIEDVVQELLRPLLKAWLDENLLPIVQAKVEEEVERIARRRF